MSEADLGLGPAGASLDVMAPESTSLPDEVTRRELFARGSAVATGLVASSALTVVGSRPHVNPAIVEHLYSLRRVLVEEDNLLGSRHLIPMVIDRVTFIDGMCRNAPSAIRSELFRLGALFEEFAGWLNQNAGNAAAALWWSDRAVERAHEADDQLLLSYLLMRKAQQAMDARDASRTVGLAQAAQRSDTLTAWVRAAAAQQEAHGHALGGSLRESERKFEEALGLAAAAQHGQGIESELGSYCTERHVRVQQATALVELGQPRPAISLFEREMALWPSSFHRDRGLFLSQFALAHAANDDPEQAAAVGLGALAIMREVCCARTQARLAELDRCLARHGRLPAVRQFRESLAALRGWRCARVGSA